MNDKELIKNALIKYMNSEFDYGSIILCSKGDNSYTKEYILEQIINDTEEGIKLQQNIVNLTINLLTINKEKL